jgi:uncharacterized protein YecT (DUF1311 family)
VSDLTLGESQGGIVRKALETTSGTLGPACLAAVLLGVVPATSRAADEPDPCAHAYGGDLRECWFREAERADEEMARVYSRLRERLPKRGAEALEKAQELWREYREEHLKTLYGVESPTRKWGLDFPICLSMSRVAVTRERIRELSRILEPDPESLCPL